jgi:hypothetical protein
MSPTPGHVPDRKLDMDLFDIINRLRRNANTSARFGQTDELQGIADEILRWSTRLRKALLDALEPGLDLNAGWPALIASAEALRKTYDSVMTLGRMNAQELLQLEQAYGEARQELERLRQEARDARA